MPTVYVALIGGFGNILFQFMFGYSIAKKYNCQLRFVCAKNKRIYPSHYIFLNDYNILKKNPKKVQKIIEKKFSHYDIQINSTNTFITGYFQSYKYSFDYFKEIRNYIISKLHDKLTKVKNIYDTFVTGTSICLHFRRTDYIKSSNYHLVIKDCSWYTKAIELLINSGVNKQDIHLVLFSDDITYLRHLDFVKDYKYTVAEDYNLDTEEIFLLMSICNHFIIPNSSYSLLAYYFRECIHAKIVVPNKWFAIDGPEHKLEDIIKITDNVIINNTD